MWPYIRAYLHRIPIFKEYGFIYPKTSRQRISLGKKAKYIMQSIKMSPYRGFPNKTFDILMGNEVPPRKKFIQSHANQADLDI